MKNNITTAKDYLNKAYALLPNQFSLQEVRANVYNAINKISYLENKKETKIRQAKIEEEQKSKNIENPLTYAQTLSSIDQMMEEEQKKLMNLKNKKDANVSVVNDIQRLHD